MISNTCLTDAMGPDAGSAGAGASPFLLAPFASGAAEIDRRRELLRKRNQRLKIGFDEADLPPEQQLEYIRCLIAARALRVQCAVMCSTVYWLPTAYCGLGLALLRKPHCRCAAAAVQTAAMCSDCSLCSVPQLLFNAALSQLRPVLCVRTAVTASGCHLL